MLGPQSTGVAQIQAPSLVERVGLKVGAWRPLQGSGPAPWTRLARGEGQKEACPAQASSSVWLARGDAGPLGEPAGWAHMPVTEPAPLACAMSLLFLLPGDSVQVRARHVSTDHQGKPEGCAGSFSGDCSSADHKKPGGRVALQVRLLGVGRVGRGAVTWGGERGWESLGKG